MNSSLQIIKNQAIILAMLFLCISSILAQGQVFWQENGICICDARATGGGVFNSELSIVRSTSKSWISAYTYHEGSYYWVYAQRIDDQGQCLWAQNGIVVSTRNALAQDFYSVEDNKGGAIIAWTKANVGQYADQISAQKVDSNGTLLWGPDGIFITGSETSVLYSLSCVSDLRGGAIIGWVISYGLIDSAKLFVQRIDSLGNLCWGENGILLTDNLPLVIMYSGMISDGKGGAIIVWSDARNGLSNYDIFAQRVDSLGVVQWQPGGVVVCNASDMQSYYRCTRSINSTIIAWTDHRHGGDADVYAQRLSDTGVNQWQYNGIPICALPSYNGAHMAVIGDSFGGAIIAWNDNRAGNNDVYVQKIDSVGNQLWTPNGIYIGTTITGVPQDPKITGVSDNRNGAIISWQDYRNQNWDIYCQRIQADGIIVWQDSGLAVCTDTSDQHWGLEIISDNCGGAIIIWRDRRPGWPRASYYGQRVGDAVAIQENIKKNENFKIKLDIYPNPSKEGVKIEWQIPECERVSLRIYDSQGRLIRKLKNGVMSKGIYIALWNGRDESDNKAPCGVYFCRLLTTKTSKIKKINLAR